MYQRIVCLSTETVEVIYALGEQQRIVGISGYTTRPAIARKEKPKISAFTSANLPKILALKPDLVLAFSDLQADIAAELIKAGVEVHVFNQRTLADILQMITHLGVMLGVYAAAQNLVQQLQQQMDAVAASAQYLTRPPLVYFEEWDAPMITGIHWVSDLIALAGGKDCFAELSQYKTARERTVQADDVAARQPDIIIGSWCGKKFNAEQVMARPDWQNIPAVQQGFITEIKSADILQPGPSVIEYGLVQLQAIIQRWSVAQAHSKHWS